MMTTGKINFLKKEFVALLQQVPFHAKPLWGKMTLQQMIEHFTDSVRIASGRSVLPLHTPEEDVPKYQQFLMSDKPFRENTINPIMPATPAPVRSKNEEEAIAELKQELEHFFTVFEANEHLTTVNPIFGNLNFQMNVQLLYKHGVHHLRQFGVNVEPVAN